MNPMWIAVCEWGDEADQTTAVELLAYCEYKAAGLFEACRKHAERMGRDDFTRDGDDMYAEGLHYYVESVQHIKEL